MGVQARFVLLMTRQKRHGDRYPGMPVSNSAATEEGSGSRPSAEDAEGHRAPKPEPADETASAARTVYERDDPCMPVGMVEDGKNPDSPQVCISRAQQDTSHGAAGVFCCISISLTLVLITLEISIDVFKGLISFSISIEIPAKLLNI
jgi:hypothetical protein